MVFRLDTKDPTIKVEPNGGQADPLDTLLYGEEINHLRAWSLRLLFFTPSAAAFIAFTHTQTYVRNAQSVGMGCIVLVGSTWSVMTSDAVHRALFLLPNLVESSIYSLFFLGLVLKFAIPSTIFLCLLYAVILYGLDLSDKMNVAIAFSVTGILGLMTLCVCQRETVARKLFLMSKEVSQCRSAFRSDAQRISDKAVLPRTLKPQDNSEFTFMRFLKDSYQNTCEGRIRLCLCTRIRGMD
jgi:hypothetical protein